MKARRTVTANDSTLNYERANAQVDVGLEEVPAPGLGAYQTRFRFGPKASFDAFFHFHAEADEFLYVSKGRVQVWVADKTFIATSRDGELRIPAWTIHRWKTFEEEEDETIVYERCEPNDGRKELFFRNIFSIVSDAQGAPSVLQIMVIFKDLDNIPFVQAASARPFKRLARLAVGIIGAFGYLLGYRAIYPEYSPHHLVKRYTEQRGRRI